MTTDEALGRLVRLIEFIEEPSLTVNPQTGNLTAFQAVLLDGSEGLAPRGDEVPGIRGARSLLEDGQLSAFCATAGDVLRGSLVNRVMNRSALDAVPVTAEEKGEHDRKGLFLVNGDDMAGIGNIFPMDRSLAGIEGDVVSELWKETAFGLMDIIYGLGQDCIDAAREDSS